MVCSAESQNQRVVWRIVAVTKSAVIDVEASRGATVWAEGYGDERPVESLTAWAKPVRAVSKVSVVSTTSSQERFSQNEWRWRTRYEVEIGVHDLEDVALL